jgi:hypothetical protein
MDELRAHVRRIGGDRGRNRGNRGFWYWATPKFFRVGYMPHQPAMETSYIKKLAADKSPLPGHDFPGFSHQIHAGKLGLDCRYCHTKSSSRRGEYPQRCDVLRLSC